MAPARKSRTNKRYTSATSYSPENDVGTSNKIRQRGAVSFSPDKDAGNSNKSTQRKKKLSDKLGPQWSKEDLERFYDAYRKHGRDWKRVAAAVRNRSAEMVEALYSMNRAYLSLPEGTASVIGLIAMMTDHYNVLEGSDSDYGSNDASGLPTKPQKRKRGKDKPSTSRDVLQSYSNPAADGCLSSWLKRKRTDVTQPRVVGKRTPRFPVQHLQRKDYKEICVSPIKSRKPEKDNEDEVEHAALVLAGASQRAGSPQVSTPFKRQEHLAPSPARSWERLVHQQTVKANAIHRGAYVDDDWLEGSVGSRGAESGDYTKDSGSILEGVGTVEVHQTGKKFYRKNEKVEDDDGGEACSGTEGLRISSVKEKHEVGVSNTRSGRISPQTQRNRSKKLFFGDDSSAFDALQTLANLSVMLPPCAMESESSAQLKAEVILDNEDKFNVPEATSSSQVRSINKVLGAKLKVSHEISGNGCTVSKKSKLGRDSAAESNSASTMERISCSDTKLWKRKRKPFSSKKSGAEVHGDSPSNEAAKTEVNLEEESKPLFKGKRSCQTYAPSKQWKSSRSSEGSLDGDPRRAGPRTDLLVATTQVPASSQVNVLLKRNSRRKMNLPQAFYSSETSSFENFIKQKITRHSSSTKEKLFSCLSSCLVRRWCTFEWFYSAIDYPWFARREFEEYLNHVGLGHIPRLTRVEWGVIRSSLGKPRRFSENFLREERDKLKQYRESVRNHYAELRTGVREGLPTDLAKPLAVGQRVIALHPRTREVHDGSVLTVDHEKCRIQFDRSDIGVEFVMDVDCMPMNPLDNMPEVLRMQKSSTYKCSLLSKEPQMNGNLNCGGPAAFISSGHVDKAQTSMNTINMQGNGESTYTISQLKAAAINIVNTRPGAYESNQSREADIRVISELTRALDKKETLLMELKKTNDEVSENQNNGDYSLRASEPFMKHYATVLVQLKEASGQVSSALLGLRQRNNHPGNVMYPWLKVPPSSGAHAGLPGLNETLSSSQESSSIVVDILKGSKLKAQAMVDAAVKAFSLSNQGEDAYAKIREALESIDNKPVTSESRVLTNKVSENLVNQNQLISCKTEPGLAIDQSVPRAHVDPNKMEMQIPTEVITSCVATLLMIQTCTERQYPPGDVAQILDSAVTSLHPCCPQNLQIYREIQTYMGRIKTQILALVPT